MTKHIAIAGLILLSLFHGIAHAAVVGLANDEIDAAMIRTIYHPTYGIGRICCYGLDNPYTVQDGPLDQKQYSSSFLLDVNSLNFNVDFIGAGVWQEGIILRLSDLDFSDGTEYLAGLTIDTNVAGLTWLFGHNFIELELGGTRLDAGLYIAGSFELASVPLPATAYLFGAALLGLITIKSRALQT